MTITAPSTVAAAEGAPAASNPDHHVCPWWIGHLMALPVRKLLENPTTMLSPYIRPGMTVLDLGSAMGFFTLPAARLVGPSGRVIAVDLQQRMIDGLQRRARRAGLAERIEARVCGEDELGLDAQAGRVDVVVAIHMMHEVPDALVTLRQVAAVLKPGGAVVLVEPKGHVPADTFAGILEQARRVGLHPAPSQKQPSLWRRWAAVLHRGDNPQEG